MLALRSLLDPRVERWLFRALVLLHLWPVLANAWFVTLDGPCHVYNARVIHDLLTGPTRLAEFVRLNPFPEPNLLCHAIMGAVMCIAPAWLAEKVVFSLIIVLTASGFRALVKRWAPDRLWMSWLALPFLLTLATRMGFINFCLGAGLLLWCMERWERRMIFERDRLFDIAALMVLLYFAHITTCMLGLCWLVLRTSVEAIRRTGGQRWRAVRDLVIVTALPAVLCIAFVATHRTAAGAEHALPFTELLRWIGEGHVWNTLVFQDELPWSATVAWTLIALGALAVFRFARMKERSSTSIALAMACTTMGIAYFVLPDSMASGGLLSQRLLLFFLLFLALFIANVRTPLRPAFLGALLVLLADTFHMPQQIHTASELSDEVEDLVKLAPSIPANTVLLPLNYGDNWMHSNVSNYLGAITGCVVLDNIGATTPHFPVLWRKGMEPVPAIGTFTVSNRPCVRLDGYAQATGEAVDAVLTWCLTEAITDTCTQDLRVQLAARFALHAVSPTGRATLYTRIR